mgnify:CR=1 FL=1
MLVRKHHVVLYAMPCHAQVDCGVCLRHALVSITRQIFWKSLPRQWRRMACWTMYLSVPWIWPRCTDCELCCHEGGGVASHAGLS